VTTLPGSCSLRRKDNTGCENAQSVIKSFMQMDTCSQKRPSCSVRRVCSRGAHQLSNTARRHSQDCHLCVHLLKVKLLAGVQAEARARAGDGMTGGGPDPAAAVRLMLRFDRLPEAARLALAFLDVWDCQVGLVRDSNVGFLGVSRVENHRGPAATERLSMSGSIPAPTRLRKPGNVSVSRHMQQHVNSRDPCGDVRRAVTRLLLLRRQHEAACQFTME